MVIVLGEKSWHPMTADKATFFIKGKGKGAFSRSYQQYSVAAVVGLGNKVQHGSSVALALAVRCCGQVFDLQHTFALVGQNTDTLCCALFLQ